MRRILTIILPLFCCALIQAQIKIHPDYISFGTVGPTTDRVADIIVENHGSANVTFLRHTFSMEFEVRQTSKTILPDSSIVIRIKFKPRHTGQYTEKPELWFSSMSTPIKIPIDANVEYVATTDTPCPDFNSRRAECCPTNMFMAEVVDKKTGKPIRDAVIEIKEQGVVQKKLKTQTDGRVTQWIPIGYYTMTATKEGYSTHTIESYVNKNYSFFRFEIEAKTPPPVPPAPPLPPPPPPVYEAVPDVPPMETLPPPAIEPVTPVNAPDEITVVTGGLPDDIAVPESEALPESRYKPNNIVFVVDVSESMGRDDKMDLMKLALLELSDALRPIDRIGLVSYSNKATLLLPSTVGDKKQEINSIVESMKSGGTTSGFSGFRRAYKEVNKNLIPEGNNQVIVITDGLFNPEDSDKIRQLVEDQANQGIRTSIVGVKSATGIQRVLEQFTQKGNGAFVALENEGDRDALLMEIREASEK